MPLRFIRQDITKMDCDAIVNASNSALRPGGGVDAAIHAAAGPRLAAACRALGGCPTGEARLTRGYRLPCKYVIHTVGPVWQGGAQGEKALLEACYRNALALALRKRCKTVAFPLIASSAFGYPKDQALRVAVDCIGAFLLEHEMTVYLVAFGSEDHRVGSRLFPDIESYIDDHYVQSHRIGSRERASRVYMDTLPDGVTVSLEDAAPGMTLDAEPDMLPDAEPGMTPDVEPGMTQNAAPGMLPDAAPDLSRSAPSVPQEETARALSKDTGPALSREAPFALQGRAAPAFLPPQMGASRAAGRPAAAKLKAAVRPGVSAAPPAPSPARPEKPAARPNRPAPPPGLSAAEPEAAALRDALRQMDESFQQMLLRKIDEKGMTDAQCYKKANVDRKLFSKIRRDVHYKPSKPTAIAFAIALELPLPESQELLMKAGYALSHSSKFDIIIEYFIQRGNYNIFEINEALFAYDQSLLGA